MNHNGEVFPDAGWLLTVFQLQPTNTSVDFHSKQKAKGIWQRLHQMAPSTRHTAYTACAAADLSCMTDRLTTEKQTDIGKNSQQLTHSTQLKKSASYLLLIVVLCVKILIQANFSPQLIPLHLKVCASYLTQMYSTVA